jgi:peptidoglycan lytic transglycosylase G
MAEGGRHRGITRLILLLAMVIIAAGAGYALLGASFRAAGPAPAAVSLKVTAGESTRTALASLAALGALAHPWAVELYLRLHHRIPRIEIGTYDIPAHASPADIVRMLQEGRVVLDQLTVVPGATFTDFRHELDASPDIAHTLRGRSDAAVMAALGHSGQNPEGRFFPDTYRFAPGTSDRTVLAMAYDRMAAVLAKAWQERGPGLPYDSPYQALILASIVEKETGVADERARIAGVFINRLRRGMRLQSDPTVIYGLGSRYDGRIHTRDLTTDTPYNSYTRSGLPPTPIALPSLESLLAALHPDQTEDLYFVATGQGGHHFSRTLEQHDAELREYLARLRAQQQAAARRQPAGSP